jgi:hypothetical protein
MSFSSISSVQSINIKKGIPPPPAFIKLLSGSAPIKTTYNGYNVYLFTAVGISTISINNPTLKPINFALVGGGGGGGYSDKYGAGGGGGGGGKMFSSYRFIK